MDAQSTSDRYRLLNAPDGADYHQPNEDRLEAGLSSQQSRYSIYSSGGGYGPLAISGQDAQRFARPEAQNFDRPPYVVGMNTAAGSGYGQPFAQVPAQHFDQQQEQTFVYGKVNKSE